MACKHQLGVKRLYNPGDVNYVKSDKGHVVDDHSGIIHFFKNALDRDMCKQSTVLRLYGNFFEV